MPKVTVIVPVYNAELHLRGCLDSVLAQTLQDIEVVCVDDGSTDESASILRQYASEDHRIAVLQQANAGAGAARNSGMAQASGEFLAFLDADDFFEPDLFSEMYSRCMADDSDMAVCSASKFLMDTGRYSAAPHFLRTDLVPTSGAFSFRDLPDHIFDFTVNATWNKLFRRSFVVREALKFQEISRANDLLFTNLALVKANKISAIDKVLVHYRVGAETNLQSTNDQAPLEFYDALIALRAELLADGLFAEVERSFVNKALAMCLYNLNSLQTVDAFRLLYGDLQSRGFRELGISGCEEAYFFSAGHYKQHVKIEGLQWDEYLFRELRDTRERLAAARRRLKSSAGKLEKATAEAERLQHSRSRGLAAIFGAGASRLRRIISPSDDAE